MRHSTKERSPGRVYGPYEELAPNGKPRWRVVVKRASGTSSSTFASLREAELEYAANQRELEAADLTVGKALEAYVKYKRESDLAERSIETTLGRLRKFLPDPDEQLRFIDTAHCQARYDELRTAAAATTHREALKEARTFFRWAKSKGLVSSNPLLTADGSFAVEPIGKKKKRKLTFRTEEAIIFRDLALGLAELGNRGALAALICLFQNLNSETEVLRIQARDIDEDGTVLWVEGTKNEFRRRQQAVAPDLVPLLKAAKELGDPVFPSTHRKWLWRAVREICDMGGLPHVSPHGLRGTHASLAREKGTSPLAVQAAMGHKLESRVTDDHYVTPEAAATGMQARVLERLGGK